MMVDAYDLKPSCRGLPFDGKIRAFETEKRKS